MKSKKREGLRTEESFYEDVIFYKKVDKKQVNEFMKKWRKNLEKFKQVRLKKFKDLLTPLEEIVLPITIHDTFLGISSFNVEMTDAEGKEYYLIQDAPYDYNKMNTYLIGRRNSQLEPKLDRDFTFQMNKEKTTLIETGALRLREDGTNGEEVVNFEYDTRNKKTKVTIKSYSSKRTIKIQYPTQDSEFDKKVLEYLFYIEKEKWYYYDVFPILEWIITKEEERITISIVSEIEKEIMSQIEIQNGIVQKYTKSEVINEGEIHIQTAIYAKEMRQFMKEQCRQFY